MSSAFLHLLYAFCFPSLALELHLQPGDLVQRQVAAWPVDSPSCLSGSPTFLGNLLRPPCTCRSRASFSDGAVRPRAIRSSDVGGLGCRFTLVLIGKVPNFLGTFTRLAFPPTFHLPLALTAEFPTIVSICSHFIRAEGVRGSVLRLQISPDWTTQRGGTTCTSYLSLYYFLLSARCGRSKTRFRRLPGMGFCRLARKLAGFSTLLTSNRPVEDWGKLLGDVAAVSAMLDRLLHHGHVLKCGPRSWRTKTAPAS